MRLDLLHAGIYVVNVGSLSSAGSTTWQPVKAMQRRNDFAGESISTGKRSLAFPGSYVTILCTRDVVIDNPDDIPQLLGQEGIYIWLSSSHTLQQPNCVSCVHAYHWPGWFEHS